MDRIWLGTTAPPLARAAAWLLDDADRNGTGGAAIDMQETICVVPGRRAGRTLLGDLVDAARSRSRSLVPPQLITPGAMGDVLLVADRPVATAPERVLAWTAALREAPPALLEALASRRPPRDDHVGWAALARTIAAAHAELAGERLDFAAALDRAAPEEAPRWRALRALHDDYRAVLHRAGLADPTDAQDGALERGRLRAVARLALVGVPELNRRQQAVAAAYAPRAVALVFAEAAHAERFDDLGCVDPRAWADVRIAIDEQRLIVADRPADQAQAVLAQLDELGGRYGAHQITVGLGDEALAAPIIHAGRWADVSFHHASGRPLRRSAPCQLLERLAGWMEEGTAAQLAELVRHPDLEAWLTRRDDGRGREPDALTRLDRHRSERLPVHVDETSGPTVAPICRAIAALTRPLDGAPRRLDEWLEHALGVLASVYGAAAGDREAAWRSRMAETCAALTETARALHRMPAALQPTVDGATALRLLLDACAAAAVAEEPETGHVEMLGWLEVALDPAPVLVVTGVNDGSIPGTVGIDPLLPERLRRALGMRHEERRYARDAYWMDLLVRSGRDVTFISGRRGPEGDPLAPSRLLLAADPDRVVERVQRFCRPDHAVTRAVPRGLAAAATSGFGVPTLPHDIAPPSAMRVTDFKRYLQCPYRYALERLLRLGRMEDVVDEMTPLQFGSLAHGVLEAFGRDATVRDSDDPRLIESFLRDELRDRALRLFGASPLPAAAVQLARLRMRLSRFAECQAEMRRDGWSLRHCEIAFTGEPALPVPDQPAMPLRGIIDRIDLHEPTGRWRVIDYKTGESGDDPMRAHHGTKPGRTPPYRWLDLQLPLYHHLVTAGELRLQGEVELGYIVLPRQLESTGFRGAAWDSAALQDAMRRAAEIVGAIRAGEFPLNHEHAPRGDAFARLCHTGALGVHDGEDAA